MVDKGGVVDAVFLDQVLMAKLSMFNFSPMALKWFESYLIEVNMFL